MKNESWFILRRNLWRLKVKMLPCSGLCENEHVLILHSVQSAALRFLIESLNGIVQDVNFVFDSSGGRLCCMDGQRSALVFAALDGAQFEEYHCASQVVLGLNMNSLFKLLKTASNSDVLTMSLKDSCRHQLHICLVNKEKNSTVRSMLRLLDLDFEMYNIPDVTFDSVFVMPSHELQRVVRDLHSIGEDITISCKEGHLVLSVVGDFASQSFQLGEKSTGLAFQRRSETEIKCKFGLKYLSLFCKASTMATVAELYMKPGFPLVLKYTCGSLGRLQFCLSPKADA